MRNLVRFAILAFCIPAGATTQYSRPMADSTQSITGLSCDSGTNIASSSMSAVYTGKSGAGPTGSSATVGATYSSGQQYEERLFYNFQTITGSITVLVLNASLSYLVNNDSGAQPCVFYSTNSGSTWTSLGSISPSQSTLSVTITGATVSNIEVLLAAQSGTSSTSSAIITAYDIWLTATVSASIGFPGFIRSSLEIPHYWLRSDVEKRIWQWHDRQTKKM